MRPSRVTRAALQSDLDVLVAAGLIVARRRPDGRIGYYPTEHGLRLQAAGAPSWEESAGA